MTTVTIKNRLGERDWIVRTFWGSCLGRSERTKTFKTFKAAYKHAMDQGYDDVRVEYLTGSMAKAMEADKQARLDAKEREAQSIEREVLAKLKKKYPVG